MRLVLGIGNVGERYAGTRHNIGFDVIDLLAARHGVVGWSDRHHAAVATWRSPHGPVLLAKPQTYVNGSGQAVQALLTAHRLTPSEMLVVVDDLHLKLGTLRLRPEGSSGGHNGLKDIELRIGQGYPRLRLGIGQPSQAQIEHVLGRWHASEQADVHDLIAKAADCVERWLSDGVTAAMAFNGPLRPPPPRPRPAPPSPSGPADVAQA